MQIPKNKTVVSIILVLALTLSALTASISTVSAATQETRAFLAVNPNPVGVGQTVDVTAILQPIPPLATDKFTGMVVTITKPDGTVETKGPMTSSPIGSQYFVYIPTMVGTYKFQFKYGGDTFKNGTYLPSESPITELIVQQNPIEPYPDNSVTTDYWTRPINAQNRLWSSISGNWLTRAYSAHYGSFGESSGYNPYSAAARAPHVMWTKELTLGGLIGGEYGAYSYYAGHSYEPKLVPPIIMNGRLYYKIYPSGTSGGPGSIGTGFVCVDVRTGEELWRNTQSVVTHGQVFNYMSGNQMGGIAYLWNVAAPAYQMFDAFTGDLLVTFANATAGDVVYGSDGTMFVYILNPQKGWVAMWNSTKACVAAGFDALTPAGLGQWRPKAGTYDWLKGIQFNTTVPVRSITTAAGGVSYPSIRARQYTSDIMYAVGGGTAEARLHVAYSMKTGEELWAIERQDTNRAYPMFFVTGDDIYLQFDPMNMVYVAYDLATGAQRWVSDPLDYPWGQYIANSIGGVIVNGKLYVCGMDGVIHCFDATNGKQLWKFSSGNSGLETPYGSWPMGSGPIFADGVVYTGIGEHSPTNPLIRGGKLFALDAQTGTKLWEMNGWISVQAIADGYLIGYNLYDNRIYCIGKGPSATTVEASPDVVQQGASLLIKGTVTDQSTGLKDTPAISDQSMGEWMAFKYEQQPCPPDVKGVPVLLDATAPDGSNINIGEVMSDSYGVFKKLWTPPTTGEYTIRATFPGSDSYGSSTAETAAGVSTAAATQKTEVTTPAVPVDLYIIAATIVILVAIAIVAVLVLRKKP
ncbi:MAG: PQQ-binding-like beta-propeller repeat protein [Candidatus Bathyarchaeia archaeon]